MASVSLCMIVKNEEEVLARCLDSVQGLVDEIIVVDTGSTDQTLEIAHRYTQNVFSFPWIDDFSAARNFSFSKATSEYILWLDADDVIRETDREGFRLLKDILSPEVDMVMIQYHLAFDQGGEPTFSNYRERLMRREKGFRWEGAVHEAITPAGKVIYEQNTAISHKKLKPSPPDRNLKIMEKHIASGAVLDPRQTFYYGRELMDNGRYEDAIAAFSGFLEDERGWLENQIEACKNLSACYLAKNQAKKALSALWESFRFDAPRAEICCEIGKCLMAEGRYAQAAFWYEQARGLTPMPERGGFLLLECYGYLPCIQLCVCYDRMGMTDIAMEMNERAAAFKPNDPSVEFNRQYFKNKQNLS